jgi:uncharacterized protein
MKLHNSFVVPRPIPAVWKVLQDIPTVVACFPGANLEEGSAGPRYRGTMSVRLGPILMEFEGEVEVVEVNEEALCMAFNAQWRERKGRGSARTSSQMTVADDSGSARLSVQTDLTMVGTVAQYGRGVSLIQALSQELMNQFADNLSCRVLAEDSCTSEVLTQAAEAAKTIPNSARALSLGGLLLAVLRRWWHNLRRTAR